jgi:hypothetical protein
MTSRACRRLEAIQRIIGIGPVAGRCIGRVVYRAGVDAVRGSLPHRLARRVRDHLTCVPAPIRNRVLVIVDAQLERRVALPVGEVVGALRRPVAGLVTTRLRKTYQHEDHHEVRYRQQSC